jgi:hypothetical protein
VPSLSNGFRPSQTVRRWCPGYAFVFRGDSLEHVNREHVLSGPRSSEARENRIRAAVPATPMPSTLAVTVAVDTVSVAARRRRGVR